MPGRLISFVSFVIIALLARCGQADDNVDLAAVVRDRLPTLELVTAERIASLPEPQGEEWTAYVARSSASALKERQILAAELQELGLSSSRRAPDNSKEFELDSKVDQAWLRSAEALSLTLSRP